MSGSCRLLALSGIAAWLCACSAGDDLFAVGTLERDRLDLVAEASEPVVERAVEEGAYVEAGALLLQLDPATHAARVAQAQAARARAAARLAELVRGPRHEQIAEGRARLQGAEGGLLTARRELERVKQLVARNVASEDQLDQHDDHLHDHDEHHQHDHAPGASVGEPHSHLHSHTPLVHEHPHVPDAHHRHRH